MVARLACCACFALTVAACTREARPPSVVLVTLDTTRPDHLGVYGYEKSTPTIDGFAAAALVYDHAYSVSSWTLPSHASLFTGLLPMQHGAQSVPEGPNRSLGYGVRPLAERFTTVAERLASRGYRTAAVVAGPALRSELGVAQGFEIYDDALDGPGEKLHGKRAEDVTDRAIEILDDIGDEPYFLFVNYFDPHAPYQAPEPFGDGASGGRDDGRLLGALLGRLGDGEPARPVRDLDPETKRLLSEKLAGYDAEIAYMDAQLGRLLAAVDEREDARDTLIAITADHGESFGEHYFLSHGGHLYEHNVRVPLLVREPGSSPRSGRVAEPVQSHRVFAAALREAGLGPPAASDAETPVVLEVRRSDSNVRMFGEFFDRDLSALVRWPYKLIESSNGRVELFDLVADPDELVNLATTAEGRAVATEMSGELATIRRRHPPLFASGTRADLRPETADALRALGYLD